MVISRLLSLSVCVYLTPSQRRTVSYILSHSRINRFDFFVMIRHTINYWRWYTLALCVLEYFVRFFPLFLSLCLWYSVSRMQSWFLLLSHSFYVVSALLTFFSQLKTVNRINMEVKRQWNRMDQRQESPKRLRWSVAHLRWILILIWDNEH